MDKIYFLAKTTEKFLNFLPLGFSLYLGKLVGIYFYYFDKKKRRNAFVNIKQVFPHKSNKELFSIIRKSFVSFGMSLVELFLIDKMKERVSLEFKESRFPSGHIFVGIHGGSWEVYSARLAGILNYAVFARKQKNKSLDVFLNELRKRSNIRACFSLREFVSMIKKGFWVTVVIDHGAEEKAQFVNFFNKLVPTPGGAVYLAKKFNRKIFPSFGYRKGTRHRLIIGEPIDCRDGEEKDILEKLNRIYEKYISSYPSQYLWWYKRFKKKKSRKILILSDNKTGHLTQSLSLLEILRESDYRIEEEIMTLKYKNRFTRALAEIIALSSGKLCLGCGKCLRFLLEKESFQFLNKRFFDIVISTGSFLAPVNLIYSRSLGAKSCVILKPNLPVSKFDLAVIPEHDRIKAGNVINVKGALANFDNPEKKIKEGKDFFNLSEGKKISLFLGNFLNQGEIFLSNLKVFLRRLKEFSLKEDYKLLVTTSRRTSLPAEKILKDELSGFKNTEAAVFVREKNYPFVVAVFLAFSDIVFVSAESVSMISESLNLGKTTVSVFLEKVEGRHKEFLSSLKDGFVNFLDYPYDDFSFDTPKKSLYQENRSCLKKAQEMLF